MRSQGGAKRTLVDTRNGQGAGQQAQFRTAVSLWHIHTQEALLARLFYKARQQARLLVVNGFNVRQHFTLHEGSSRFCNPALLLVGLLQCKNLVCGFAYRCGEEGGSHLGRFHGC